MFPFSCALFALFIECVRNLPSRAKIGDGVDNRDDVKGLESIKGVGVGQLHTNCEVLGIGVGEIGRVGNIEVAAASILPSKTAAQPDPTTAEGLTTPHTSLFLASTYYHFNYDECMFANLFVFPTLLHYHLFIILYKSHY